MAEKYGVEQEEEVVKTASRTKSCPSCGLALLPSTTTGILRCPECGSKPFEKAATS